MQEFLFSGIILAIAIGVALIKGILFIIHIINLKKSNEIISGNLAQNQLINNQTQQIQNNPSTIESVANWRLDDAHLTVELRQQFLTKTKTRRTPTSDGASPRERVPLATTDLGEPFEEDLDESVPIYTYNPNIRGTQV